MRNIYNIYLGTLLSYIYNIMTIHITCVRAGLLVYIGGWYFLFLSPFRARSHCGFSNEIKKPWRRKAKHTTLCITPPRAELRSVNIYIIILLYERWQVYYIIFVSYRVQWRTYIPTVYSCVYSKLYIYIEVLAAWHTLSRPRCSKMIECVP